MYLALGVYKVQSLNFPTTEHYIYSCDIVYRNPSSNNGKCKDFHLIHNFEFHLFLIILAMCLSISHKTRKHKCVLLNFGDSKSDIGIVLAQTAPNG